MSEWNYGDTVAAESNNKSSRIVELKKENTSLRAQLAESQKLLEEVKQACLFSDDDGSIGVNDEPYIEPELFNAICKFLKGKDNEQS